MNQLDLAKKIIKKAYLNNLGGMIIIPTEYLEMFYDIPARIRMKAQTQVLAEEEPKWLQPI